MAVYIVMLGAPGVGKGTQAQLIADRFGFPHISSGDLFRENLKNETELGKTAQEYMNKGELVPDDVTIGMIRERFSQPDCTMGAVLDGFPRTSAQAEDLDKMLEEFQTKVTVVPYIKVAESVLIKRLTGRLTCRENGHIFHKEFNKPKQNGICDHDGSELYQREDDSEETVTNRINVYMEQTTPLIEYYKKAGTLHEINGEQPIEKVTDALLDILPFEK